MNNLLSDIIIYVDCIFPEMCLFIWGQVSNSEGIRVMLEVSLGLFLFCSSLVHSVRVFQCMFSRGVLDFMM
jgi:hypothetical protein